MQGFNVHSGSPHKQNSITKTTTTTTATTTQMATSKTSATDASKMLEAALQQMDGIISGATAAMSGTTAVGASSDGQSSSIASNSTLKATTKSALPLGAPSLISAKSVISTAKTLALALEQVGVTAPAPDAATATIISDWLYTHIPRQDADESLRRLQRDKESLALQYEMLVERVAEQADKISELERLLTERTQQLSVKEEELQRQMLTRSTLETQKLELLTALSEFKLHRIALERENVELKVAEQKADNGNVDAPDGNTSTNRLSRRSSCGSLGNLPTGNIAPKTPPASLRHQILPQFHSLPRSHASKLNNINNKLSNRSLDANANTNAKRNVVFASNEKILIDDQTESAESESAGNTMYNSYSSQTNATPSPNLRERSAKGLRNIFGRLRRSNSSNLELPALEQAEPEFKRGGSRATAGGRIEWSTQTSAQSSQLQSCKAYTEWLPQEICNWLVDLGLGCYEEDCRKWLKANPNVDFFSASPVDIEKELGLKVPLHRKKIQLAIDELTGREQDVMALKAGQLDASWVMRWLDDIGLPQYKDTFLQAKVDGRMLHRMTMEDLAQLHVSSCLHIASLRCGIQCMREMEWHPECLIRRSINANCAPTTSPSPARSISNEAQDESAAGSEIADDEEQMTECIALWTAHRVMEWLRVADLSEYAPNLRGAGVHGALMLYEPRFNANLLADLLSIPPSKTLLRRHLATHFKELLGRDIIHAKRDIESAAGYQPLTITAKLKPPKKTQFSIKRRKSTKGVTGEVEWSDYVCPMPNTTHSPLSEQQNAQSNSTTSSTSTNNSNSLQSN